MKAVITVEILLDYLVTVQAQDVPLDAFEVTVTTVTAVFELLVIAGEFTRRQQQLPERLGLADRHRSNLYEGTEYEAD